MSTCSISSCFLQSLRISLSFALDRGFGCGLEIQLRMDQSVFIFEENQPNKKLALILFAFEQMQCLCTVWALRACCMLRAYAVNPTKTLTQPKQPTTSVQHGKQPEEQVKCSRCNVV